MSTVIEVLESAEHNLGTIKRHPQMAPALLPCVQEQIRTAIDALEDDISPYAELKQ